MKKKTTLLIFVSIAIVLAVVSLVIVFELKKIGTGPVAPQPKAADEFAGITPAPGCRLDFGSEVPPTLPPTQTPTQPPTTPTVPPVVPTEVPPTDAPTDVPTPTSTESPSDEPYCDYLTANPTSGRTVLTVNFTGKGHDKTRIKGFRFSYGDGEKDEFTGSFTSDHIQTAAHEYTGPGTFIAQLEILDDSDHWLTSEKCRATILVSSGEGSQPTDAPNPTTPPNTSLPTQALAQEPAPTEVELPMAGLKIPSIGGLLGGLLMLAIGVALVF